MSPKPAAPALWLPFLLALAIQLGALARSDWSVAGGGLFDADAYMRLMRVQQLHDTGAWHDSLFRRSNAPFGELLHWTRPFDVLLLLGALALAPLLGFSAALHAWGVAVSPLLQLLAIPALYWAARPLHDTRARAHLALMFLFQLGIVADFAVGRADHHSLIALAHILLLGVGLRLTDGERQDGVAALGGLVIAFALWLSIETVVAIAVLLGTLAVLWLRHGGNYARLLAILSLTATLAITCILPVERAPAVLLAAEYDRISVVHLLCFALQGAFWLLAERLAPGGIAGRALHGALAGAAALGAMALVYPKFFLGPAVDIDPEVYRIWFKGVAEVTSPLRGHDPVRVAQRALVYFGTAVVAAIALVHILRRTAGVERRRWALLAAGLAVFLPLALYQVRWIAYAQTLAVFPFALLSVGAQDWLSRRMPPDPSVAEMPQRLALGMSRLLAVLLLGGGFVLLSGLLPRLLPTEPLPSYCKTDGIAPVLADRSDLGNRPRNIMSFLFIGPELAYRTPHAVVSTPYHRNTEGILDGIRFFRATDDATAIARHRSLDLVLICPKDEEHDMYIGRDGQPSLFDRLRDGAAPDWLKPVALPPAAADFRLYVVTLP